MMDRLIKLAPKLLGHIARLTHVNIPARCHIQAKVTVRTGFGVDAGVCLGWANTAGYRMLGVKGKLGALAKVGGDLMAGLHRDRGKVKAVIGIGNVLVELVFELRAIAASDEAQVLSDPEQTVHLAEGVAPPTPLAEPPLPPSGVS